VLKPIYVISAHRSALRYAPGSGSRGRKRPAHNVSTRRNGPRSETRRRDCDVEHFVRDETETRRYHISGVGTVSRVETKTSRPRPNPWFSAAILDLWLLPQFVM